MLIRLLCAHEMTKRLQNFMFKFQAVVEKTAKNFRGPLYFAAPCIQFYIYLKKTECYTSTIYLNYSV